MKYYRREVLSEAIKKIARGWDEKKLRSARARYLKLFRTVYRKLEKDSGFTTKQDNLSKQRQVASQVFRLYPEDVILFYNKVLNQSGKPDKEETLESAWKLLYFLGINKARWAGDKNLAGVKSHDRVFSSLDRSKQRKFLSKLINDPDLLHTALNKGKQQLIKQITEKIPYPSESDQVKEIAADVASRMRNKLGIGQSVKVPSTKELRRKVRSGALLAKSTWEYWTPIIHAVKDDKEHKYAVIDGRFFVVNPWKEEPRGRIGAPSSLGFAGQVFNIKWKDGFEMKSNDVWNGSEVPAAFSRLLPDNAILVKGDF